jgi:hypothetical protein
MTLFHFFRQRGQQADPVEPIFAHTRESSQAEKADAPGAEEKTPHLLRKSPQPQESSLTSQADDLGVEDTTLRVLYKSLPDKATGSHAILDLVSMAPPMDTGKTASPQPMTGSSAAKDLVASLQAQYGRALDDPQVSLTGGWADNSDDYALAGAAVTPAPGATADKKAEEPESIETMLSGSRRLEDFFGSLGELGPTFMGIEPVPEVLRLFAPPEYQAAHAQSPSIMPPELTRREHHEISIDSPLRSVLERPIKSPSPSSSGQS